MLIHAVEYVQVSHKVVLITEDKDHEDIPLTEYPKLFILDIEFVFRMDA